MKLHTLSVLLLCAATGVTTYTMDSSTKTEVPTGSPALLPVDYQATLTEIFKKHKDFEAAAQDVRALATQSPIWKCCLDDKNCAGTVITFGSTCYAPTTEQLLEAHDAGNDEEYEWYDPITFIALNAVILDTPGAYAWCKEQCTKNPKFINPVHNYLKAICGDATPNIATATKLLNMKVIDLNVIHRGPYQIPTALTAVATCGHKELIPLLIEHGAKTDIPCPMLGLVPLTIASLNGHVECVEKLIAAGANVHAKNRMSGLTALACAKDDAIIQLLKKAGAHE